MPQGLQGSVSPTGWIDFQKAQDEERRTPWLILQTQVFY
jgi:hypothetical protein